MAKQEPLYGCSGLRLKPAMKYLLPEILKGLSAYLQEKPFHKCILLFNYAYSQPLQYASLMYIHKHATPNRFITNVSAPNIHAFAPTSHAFDTTYAVVYNQ